MFVSFSDVVARLDSEAALVSDSGVMMTPASSLSAIATVAVISLPEVAPLNNSPLLL
ncbi:hypothetical protein [Geitlerinema sp. PCC 9228]|uniref:hypothetical protein n=1 Tax=Geitlerinema sp. PCC 9228 TaxID=111611 RepID=UPI001B8DA63F|nr:hypothetical protein [Geitlerinema sp. PCC 9228]